MNGVHIDCFSSLDDLKAKERKDTRKVLAALASTGRFSCFEASEYADLAASIRCLTKSGLIKLDTEHSGYPWVLVTITPEGHDLLAGKVSP